MTTHDYNKPTERREINIPNPNYGQMGRKVTPTDTSEAQCSQAMIPKLFILTYKIDPSKSLECLDVAMVRMRLQEWQDYHEQRSSSQPGPSSYSVVAQVADELFRSRRPMPSISTPNPKLDLRVSDETITLMLNQRRQSQKRQEGLS